jgi:2-dehydro-3-deoxyphosphogluconate aldolase / (4S)-4-hydroxy-2-oxoglutarate aldolase
MEVDEVNEIINKIGNVGIVPVIKIDNPENAVPLAKALYEGGLPVAEVTFRTAHAKEAIARISKELPDMLVGAGTVLTTEQVDDAVEAGVKFIVSPGFNPTVVKYCVDRGIVIVPGCVNPSDIERAIELGLEVVKFFPAEAYGGIKTIKALSAPYTKMKFIPTGGIDPSNLNSYLSFERVIACGGSWMVKEELINSGDFNKIKALSKDAVEQMLGFEIAHVGINTENSEEAHSVADMFSSTFGFTKKEGNSSIFTACYIEVMKTPFLGKNGHIAIKTNSAARAVNYLKSKGVEFIEDTARYDEKGNLLSIYLKEEAGGFAVHLLQKK